MVPTLVSSETLNEYGLPRNSGGLSLTSTMAISLLNDTVFESESLIGSSKNLLALTQLVHSFATIRIDFTSNADDHFKGIQCLPIQVRHQCDYAGRSVDAQVLATNRVRYPRAVRVDRRQFINGLADRSVLGYGKSGHVSAREKLRRSVSRLAFRRPENGQQHEQNQPDVHHLLRKKKQTKTVQDIVTLLSFSSLLYCGRESRLRRSYCVSLNSRFR